LDSDQFLFFDLYMTTGVLTSELALNATYLNGLAGATLGILRIKMLNGFQQKTKKAYESSAQFACESTKNIRTVAALTREEDILRIYHNMLDEPMRQ
ncbi:8542_t:CDS:2, partial [Racocetra fulgida]